MKYLFFVLSIFVSSLLFSQAELPKSICNIGLGFGATHGGIGVKTVLGKRNSGLLLGLGKPYNTSFIGYTIGLQLSEGPFYANLGYGVVGASSVNDGPYNPIIGGSILIGSMLSLGTQKRTYIDISIGTSFAATQQIGFMEVKTNVVIFNLGFGYRFGTYGKREYLFQDLSSKQ